MCKTIGLDEKVLTILGKGKSWKKCPFEGEIWAVASVLITPGMEDKHYDLLFSSDSPEAKVDNGKAPNRVKLILPLAKEKGIPIISTYPYGDERYPVLDIYKEFGTTYLKNSISFMIALAILRGYTTIHLYGVDQDEELDAHKCSYVWGKPHVTFWLGVAHGRGIKFTVANTTFPRQMTSGMQLALDKIYAPPMKKEEILCLKA